MRAVLEQAAAAGLNVVRTFAHTTEPKYPLQAGGAAKSQAVPAACPRTVPAALHSDGKVLHLQRHFMPL